MTAPLLDIDGLTVTFPSPRGPVEVVRNLSFTLGRERLGIVGESGSGKSMTGRSILKLIRSPGKITARKLAFDGIDLMAQSEKQMRAIRGARISMVMQDPKFSLNPVMTIGEQIGEALVMHQRIGRADLGRRVRAMLEAVRIDDPDRVAKLYPHEVSGGMGQRVMIAMMLIPEPDLLIADEPTSALDVSVKAQIVNLLQDLQADMGLSMLFISHDLSVVRSFADEVVVMLRGRVVERAPTDAIFANARHPYTRALLDAVPVADPRARRRRTFLSADEIAGATPRFSARDLERPPLLDTAARGPEVIEVAEGGASEGREEFAAGEGVESGDGADAAPLALADGQRETTL